MTRLEPAPNEDFLGRPMRAVFAASDGLWPMYFAIVNRRAPGLTVLRNLCFRRPSKPKLYHFAISRSALESGCPFTPGWVYAVPRAYFGQGVDEGGQPAEEWHSAEPVDVLEAIEVVPEDFPFLAEVAPVDDEDLLSAGERERFDQLIRSVAGAIVDIRELADGVELRFPLSMRASLDELALLLDRDSPFLRAEISADGEQVVGRLSGGPGTGDLVLATLTRYLA